jgi:protein ImuB
MSVLYCTIPHFAAALARRDHPELAGGPLVLIGPEDRVFGVSAEAALLGVTPGMTARMVQVRCPEARLLEADTAHFRIVLEALLQLLEGTSPEVEPHGWGAAYVDLGDLVRGRSDAVTFCREVGRKIRGELGQSLQPALGWDSSKFTAQAAARRTLPGHLRAVDGRQEREFLRPLPASLLPLEGEVLQRLGFLGLRTLGQYGALPRAAVWQQFGRAGVRAHSCARGEDDRPVVSRRHAPQLSAGIEFEVPVVERERLLAASRRLVSPLLAKLRSNLQACGQIHLTVYFDGGNAQERARTFLFPVAEEERVVRALGELLDKMQWSSGATGLAVTLAQIQEVVVEQLALFPLEDERKTKIQEVERYLATRFGYSPFGSPPLGSLPPGSPPPGSPPPGRHPKGRQSLASSRLRRPVLTQPNAPLPEWRVSWQSGEGG